MLYIIWPNKVCKSSHHIKQFTFKYLPTSLKSVESLNASECWYFTTLTEEPEMLIKAPGTANDSKELYPESHVFLWMANVDLL